MTKEEIITQPKKLIMDKEVKMVVSFPDHFRMVLKAANGDTFTTKSEELIDFISSCKPVAEEGKQTFTMDEVILAMQNAYLQGCDVTAGHKKGTSTEYIIEYLTEYLKTKQLKPEQ